MRKKIVPIIMSASILATMPNMTLALDNEKSSGDVVYLSGSNRKQTSFETINNRKYYNTPKSRTVILVNGYKFADALSAYNLIVKNNANLVLVTDNNPYNYLDNDVDNYIILGGYNSISRNFENKLSKYKNVSRIAGFNRYETNKKSLEGFRSVGVADGRNYPDALSASGILRSGNLGLMLVEGNKPYTTNKKVVYTFGGKNSVFQNGGYRIAGKNRYETSMKVYNTMPEHSSAIITDGSNFADALSSINVVNSIKQNGNYNNPVILMDTSNKEKVKEISKNILKSNKHIFVVGGKIAKKYKKTLNDIKNLVKNVKPIDEYTEYNNEKADLERRLKAFELKLDKATRDKIDELVDQKVRNISRGSSSSSTSAAAVARINELTKANAELDKKIKEIILDKAKNQDKDLYNKYVEIDNKYNDILKKYNDLANDKKETVVENKITPVNVHYDGSEYDDYYNDVFNIEGDKNLDSIKSNIKNIELEIEKIENEYSSKLDDFVNGAKPYNAKDIRNALDLLKEKEPKAYRNMNSLNRNKHGVNNIYRINLLANNYEKLKKINYNEKDILLDSNLLKDLNNKFDYTSNENKYKILSYIIPNDDYEFFYKQKNSSENHIEFDRNRRTDELLRDYKDTIKNIDKNIEYAKKDLSKSKEMSKVAKKYIAYYEKIKLDREKNESISYNSLLSSVLLGINYAEGDRDIVSQYDKIKELSIKGFAKISKLTKKLEYEKNKRTIHLFEKYGIGSYGQKIDAEKENSYLEKNIDNLNFDDFEHRSIRVKPLGDYNIINDETIDTSVNMFSNYDKVLDKLIKNNNYFDIERYFNKDLSSIMKFTLKSYNEEGKDITEEMKKDETIKKYDENMKSDIDKIKKILSDEHIVYDFNQIKADGVNIKYTTYDIFDAIQFGRNIYNFLDNNNIYLNNIDSNMYTHKNKVSVYIARMLYNQEYLEPNEYLSDAPQIGKIYSLYSLLKNIDSGVLNIDDSSYNIDKDKIKKYIKEIESIFKVKDNEKNYKILSLLLNNCIYHNESYSIINYWISTDDNRKLDDLYRKLNESSDKLKIAKRDLSGNIKFKKNIELYVNKINNEVTSYRKEIDNIRSTISTNNLDDFIIVNKMENINSNIGDKVKDILLYDKNKLKQIEPLLVDYYKNYSKSIVYKYNNYNAYGSLNYDYIMALNKVNDEYDKNKNLHYIDEMKYKIRDIDEQIYKYSNIKDSEIDNIESKYYKLYDIVNRNSDYIDDKISFTSLDSSSNSSIKVSRVYSTNGYDAENDIYRGYYIDYSKIKSKETWDRLNQNDKLKKINDDMLNLIPKK